MVKRNLKSSPYIRFLIPAVTICIVMLIVTALILHYRNTTSLNQALNTATQSDTINEKPAIQSGQSDTTLDGRHLTLQDWGVKFEIPKGLEAVKYYKGFGEVYGYTKKGAKAEIYRITTAEIESLGGKGDNICVEPNDRGFIPPNQIIVRLTEPVDEFTPLSGKPVGGYYYYLTGSPSYCSDDGIDMQTAQMKAIEAMLETISRE